MAVQAQYPSNVLLLNNRNNGQEGLDYNSFQQQPVGGFLDQSSMLFNNGGANNNNNNNQRKRPREVPSQLIHLSQLHNHHHHHHQSQPNVVSTGLRLSFGDQQQIQQNHHYHHHHQQQSFNSQSSPILSFLSEDFASQIKRQREEIDQFLKAQGEQLRRTLAEKRNRHYRALITAAEDSIGRRLREKEAEVEKAARRNAELEARAAQLSVEAQVWQAKARAQEATAASLQAQLQHAIMNGVGGVAHDNNRNELSGGGGGGVEGQAEDAESAYVDPERVIATVSSSGGPTCKGCLRRAATVVVLPCRHLCICTECDQLAQACPHCLQVRNSSVEVFLY